MSRLLIDLGNSRVKWRYCPDRHAEGAMGDMQAAPHAGDPRRLVALPMFDEPRPDTVVCGSVAGRELDHALTEHCLRCWSVTPRFARSEARRGRLINAYAQPSKMGVDRWLALVAASNQCRGAFAVIDAGTAVTVDAVAADGRHLGGWIFPGRALMHHSLRRGTAKVQPPALELSGPWGQDTAGCVAAGIAAAVGGAVGTMEQLLRQEHAKAEIFICGGDGRQVLNWLNSRGRLQPDLVLRGLRDTDDED